MTSSTALKINCPREILSAWPHTEAAERGNGADEMKSNHRTVAKCARLYETLSTMTSKFFFEMFLFFFKAARHQLLLKVLQRRRFHFFNSGGNFLRSCGGKSMKKSKWTYWSSMCSSDTIMEMVNRRKGQETFIEDKAVSFQKQRNILFTEMA